MEELEEHNWGVEEELEGVVEEQGKSAGDEEKKRLEERSSVDQSCDEREQNSGVFSTKIASTLDPNKNKQSSIDMPELGANELDDDNDVENKEQTRFIRGPDCKQQRGRREHK